MKGLTSHEGNSVIARHTEQERIDAIHEHDEAGVLPECEACGERTMEKVYMCKAADGKPTTAYCYVQGKRGCLWRLTQRCLDAKDVMRCSRCGHTEDL